MHAVLTESNERASVNGCKQKRGVIRVSKRNGLEFSCGIKKVKQVDISTNKNESYVTFAGEISYRKVCKFGELGYTKTLWFKPLGEKLRRAGSLGQTISIKLLIRKSLNARINGT